MVDTVARPDHDAVRLVTRLYAEWRLSGIEPPWNRQTEVIRDAMVSAGFATRSAHPIPDDWVADINRTVRWKLGCLHLMEPKKGYFDQAQLTDGGAKFLLEVRDVEREISGAK
ncbi:hypothetical protein [Arthrobacter sp. HS15c]|uniref:hypothetical protein n=1 Tax=Arthrobacter sp. HS15c TaxID=3230279 RepID=UPI003467EBB7